MKSLLFFFSIALTTLSSFLIFVLGGFSQYGQLASRPHLSNPPEQQT